LAAGNSPQRPTITEIARLSGVSAGAVSYALNGRPGVSDETRARILKIANDIGWVPSQAARALRGGGTATLGLVITREPEVLGIEPFFMAFVGGIEQVIADQGYALLLQVRPDPARAVQTYRDWWSARRVDGIFVTDLVTDDPRLAVLREIGMPAVVVGDPGSAQGLPAVGSDDAGTAAAAVSRLAKMGHRRIGHVAGPVDFVHTQIRSHALRAAAVQLGVAIVIEVNTDYSLPAGAAACAAALSLPEPPTVLVCDNDLTAIGAMRAAAERGVSVPEELSILAWDDSPLCQFTDPPISALRREVSAYGAAAARALLAVVKGTERDTLPWASVATLIDRGSLTSVPHGA